MKQKIIVAAVALVLLLIAWGMFNNMVLSWG